MTRLRPLLLTDATDLERYVVEPDFAGEHQRFGFRDCQRQLAAYLFDHTTAERIEASTAADNLAEQRALEKAGFTREGVMRRAQWREGAWRDEVLFSKLRGES